jgi:hypothetical protein
MLSVDMSPVQWTDGPSRPHRWQNRSNLGAGGRRFKSGHPDQKRSSQRVLSAARMASKMIRRLGQAKQLSTAGGAVALHPAPGSSSDSSTL